MDIQDNGHHQSPTPDHNGTGSNNPVSTSGTVVVKEENEGKDHQVQNNPIRPADSSEVVDDVVLKIGDREAKKPDKDGLEAMY